MGYQKTIDALRAEVAELKAKLDETYVDDEGNVWSLVKGVCDDDG